MSKNLKLVIDCFNFSSLQPNLKEICKKDLCRTDDAKKVTL